MKSNFVKDAEKLEDLKKLPKHKFFKKYPNCSESDYKKAFDEFVASCKEEYKEKCEKDFSENIKRTMNKVVLKKIEQYKDSEKDDEKTKKIVERYLDSKFEHISSLEELFMNLTTGVNAHLINYELAEQEFNRIRN